jgi:hypothetical protein
MISGKFECRKVQYEVDDVISDYSHCHCSQSPRLHRSAFASFAAVPDDKLSRQSKIRI